MKTDFKKTLASLKAPRGKFETTTIPPMQHLHISGGEGPYSDGFKAALQTIYPLAYKLKFHSKSVLGRDYVVPPLEALWWADDMSVFTTNFDQSKWLWTAMLMVPDWLGASDVDLAMQDVSKSTGASRLSDVLLVPTPAFRCVQTLHVGPFSKEGPILQELHQRFIPDNGFEMCGKHHEIYLSDFRRAKPDNLRTILRQPVKRPYEPEPF